MAERPGPATLTAIALTTACTLAFQVVLSRFFSAVIAYHFSFLAVSIAMLGMGAGAMLVYVRPSWFECGSTGAVLGRLCAGFSASLIAIPFLLVRIDFTQHGGLSAPFAASLALSCLFCALPGLFSGLAVVLAVARYRAWIGSVYAADLAGAGLGALAVVPALYLGDPPTLLVGMGLAAALAAALFAGPARAERYVALLLLALAGGGIGVSRLSQALRLPHYYDLPPDALQVVERWTPLARVFGFRLHQNDQIALLFYDRVFAPVPMVRAQETPGWKELNTGPGSVGYELTAPGRVLIIGGGGGRDIYTALSSGQKRVDVIELIDANRRVVDEDLGGVSGSPYSRPRVSTVIGDGRSVLAGRKVLYDQIYIGFTDTLSANAAQGYALMESNLYTVEAFVEYLRHLRPGGVLNVTRPVQLVGDEALRITVLTLAALGRLGVSEPGRHLAVVGGREMMGPPVGAVLARLEPYTQAELERLRRLAAQRGDGLVFAPGGPFRGAWKELARSLGMEGEGASPGDFSAALERFCNGWRLDVCPPTDDRPFFFSMQRLSQLGENLPGYHYSVAPDKVLMLTLLVLALFSVVAFLLPLAAVRQAPRPPLSAIGYFGAIGLGYMLLEVVLIQRMVLFLGFPTYALSVVLFSLLLFSGIGSYLSSRARDERKTLLRALTALVAMLAAAAFFSLPLVHRLIHLGFALRAAAAVALIAPLGAVAGAAMPLGLKRFGRLHPRSVAYAWGVNGICSVLASVLGIALAMHLGFAAATLAAAACYLLALLQAALGGWTRAVDCE